MCGLLCRGVFEQELAAVVASVHAPESEGNLECWAHEDALIEIITRERDSELSLGLGL